MLGRGQAQDSLLYPAEMPQNTPWPVWGEGLQQSQVPVYKTPVHPWRRSYLCLAGQESQAQVMSQRAKDQGQVESPMAVGPPSGLLGWQEPQVTQVPIDSFLARGRGQKGDCGRDSCPFSTPRPLLTQAWLCPGVSIRDHSTTRGRQRGPVGQPLFQRILEQHRVS